MKHISDVFAVMLQPLQFRFLASNGQRSNLLLVKLILWWSLHLKNFSCKIFFNCSICTHRGRPIGSGLIVKVSVVRFYWRRWCRAGTRLRLWNSSCSWPGSSWSVRSSWWYSSSRSKLIGVLAVASWKTFNVNRWKYFNIIWAVDTLFMGFMSNMLLLQGDYCLLARPLD